MLKNLLSYTIAFSLLLVILLFFNSAYRALTDYAEQMNGQNKVHSSFENLSLQINNAAVITPQLSNSNRSIVNELFFSDSENIIHQLTQLKTALGDSMSTDIIHQLDSVTRLELSWLINSSIIDSIVSQKSPEHIAAFRKIMALITQGIERTSVLSQNSRKNLNNEIRKVRWSIMAFIIISGLLLIYTTSNFFKQQSIRRKKEKELETTLNRIRDGVVSLDNNWNYTFLNDASLSAHPLGREKTMGRSLWEIHPQLRGTAFGNMYEESKRTKEVLEEESYYAPMDKWFSAKAYPSDDGLTIYFRDVTENKRAQRDIEELNRNLEEKIALRTEELRKSNEDLEAFTYSVSHDLRAPLRAIIGFTAILEEDYSSRLDEEAKRITSIIQVNTLKMGHLIDDLLTFSRLGRKDIAKTEVKTNDLVKEVIATIMSQNLDGRTRWEVQSLPNVNADTNALRQVWINLISNAVKYSQKNEHPHIQIGYSQTKEDTLFFVKDNGVGFDEKYKHKLFKVFQRLHSEELFEGTGVGLAIVERIIIKHGGKVWAEAKENEGATFWFSLPNNI